MSQKEIKKCPKHTPKNWDTKWDNGTIYPDLSYLSQNENTKWDNFGTAENTSRAYFQRICPSVPLFLPHSIIITNKGKKGYKTKIYCEGEKNWDKWDSFSFT